ncbi:hypothetical protein SHIRM173S_08671 [Streptomyces hirsutus]
MPIPAGLSTVQRRTVGRPPPRTSMPAADRVTTRMSRSSGVPSSISRAGAAASCPSTCRSWTTAEARYGQRNPVQGRDAHRAGRALGTAQGHRPFHDEILPVGARSDGEDVAFGRGLQGGGERRVLTCAAPPPRCAGVRHLDRALCHGVAVPPPCRTRVCRRFLRPDHRSVRTAAGLTRGGRRSASGAGPAPVGAGSVPCRSRTAYRCRTMRRTISRRAPSIRAAVSRAAPKPASTACVVAVAVSSGRAVGRPSASVHRGKCPPGRGSFRRTRTGRWCPVPSGAVQRAMTRVRRACPETPSGSRSGRAGSRTRTTVARAWCRALCCSRTEQLEGRPRWRSRRGRATSGAATRPSSSATSASRPSARSVGRHSGLCRQRRSPLITRSGPHPLALPVITPRRIRPFAPRIRRRERTSPPRPSRRLLGKANGRAREAVPAHARGTAGGYKGGLTRRPPGEVIHGTRREGITAGPSGGRACAASVRRGP